MVRCKHHGFLDYVGRVPCGVVQMNEGKGPPAEGEGERLAQLMRMFGAIPCRRFS